jgi:hypothetical protein
MSLNGVSLFAVGFEAGWHVVIVQAIGVEPILQRRAPSAMAEHAAVPDSLERRYFVVAGATASLERQIGIGANGDWQYLVLRPMIGGHGEAFGGSELVVGVERRRVAGLASFAPEDLLAARARSVELVGVWRGFERIDVEGESVELFIAVAAPTAMGSAGSGSFLKLGMSANMKPSKLARPSAP